LIRAMAFAGFRPLVPISVPPPARTATGATEAEDALPIAVQKGAFGNGLRAFAIRRRRCVSTQPQPDRTVLGEQMALVRDQVFDNRMVV